MFQNMRKCFEKYFLIFLGVQNSPQSLRVSLKVNKRRLKSNSSTIIDGFLKYEELFKKSSLIRSELNASFTASCYYDNLAYAVLFRITNRSGALSLSPFFRVGE